MGARLDFCQGQASAVLLYIKEHGSAYANELDSRGFSKPHIYRTLHRLTYAGLLTQTLERGEGRGGLRAVYRLTDTGSEVADHLAAIEQLINRANEALS